MNKFLLVLMSTLILSSCATVTHEQMEKEVADYTLPHKDDSKMATIYIVRPSSLGGLIRFNVFVNNQLPESEMGWTRGNQYIYFKVVPGIYKILSKAENWAETNLEVKSGEIYFVRQDAHMGIIMARNSLITVDAIEGKYHVKKTTPGEFIKKSIAVADRPAGAELGNIK